MTAAAEVDGSLAPADVPDLCHRLATSFGGVIAYQIWADFYLWELVLNDRPALGAIIEIGSAEGGFSRYLWAQAELRGMDFWTCDALEPAARPPGFERVDVWAKPDYVRYIIRETGKPVILLCDGGNKPREAETFGPMLPPGSLLVVHDWGTEFLPADVPEGFVEVYGEACDALGSMSRMFEPPDERNP